MSIEVKVPDLGDGLDSGDVLNVLVAVGDVVNAEQGIVELETDKAVAEIPTTQAGRVAAVHVQVGETVAIGASLITLETEKSPQNTEEAKVDEPQVSQEVAEQIEPTSHSPNEPAPTAGTDPPTVAPTANVETEVEAVNKKTTSAPTSRPTPMPVQSPMQPLPQPGHTDSDTSHQSAASPAIRRYARELGVNLALVKGTGPDGRITQEDIRGEVRVATGPTPSGSKTAAATTKSPSGTTRPEGEASEDPYGPILRSSIPKIRATIAKNMVHSKATAPHVTNFDDADITELEQIRQSSKKDYAAAGIKLTSMPFVVRSVAQALRGHPTINASIDIDANEIIYKQYVNVGVAVDTERGLVVPVIRNADELGIPQVAREIAHFAEKSREGKLGMDDMRGGTFTISNLGAIGGTYSTPIINVPEVAILLVGRSREMPIVKDGEVKIRLMMPLSLSYDHRLVDGAAAARFLNDVKGYLETPSRLLIAP
jgi:pyruvate/2-oxoglutarate dehydrogenase complex dihydrolipoamide acyltransferase (E2) component